MTGNFTPGPWPVTRTGDGKRFVIGDGLVEGPNGYEVAEVYSDDCPRELAEANARLIAAAPDLYEALQQAEAFISIALPHYAKDRNEAVEILPGIRTALAKASGEVFSRLENCASSRAHFVKNGVRG